MWRAEQLVYSIYGAMVAIVCSGVRLKRKVCKVGI
jgi:hypothetical protein